MSIVFPTAKKKGRALNIKIGHSKYTKGAIFSEKGHFSFGINNWNKQVELFKFNY